MAPCRTPPNTSRRPASASSRARELFNRRGFEQVSIDDIMRRAGLTRGGFYNHFKAKEDLFVEAVLSFRGFDPRTRRNGTAHDRDLRGKPLARRVVDTYLSQAHLDNADNHCPMIALPSDVARATPRVKQAYRQLLEGMAKLLAESQATQHADEARRHGLALAALCVGGMVLARTFDDPQFRQEAREAARTTALDLVDRRPNRRRSAT